MRKIILCVFSVLCLSGSANAQERISLKTIHRVGTTKTEPQIKRFVNENSGKTVVASAVVFKVSDDDDSSKWIVYLKTTGGDIIEATTDSETALSLQKGFVYQVSGEFTDLLDTDPERHPLIHEVVKFMLDNQSTALVITVHGASFENGREEGRYEKAERSAKSAYQSTKRAVGRLWRKYF